MASIKKISLKNVTHFKGHEGEPLIQGNIYLENKKIGYFSMDSWGGPNLVQIDQPYQEIVAKTYLDFVKDYPSYDWAFDERKEDCFWAALTELIDMEADFKKYLKKGYDRMAFFYDDFGKGPSKVPITVSYVGKAEVEKGVLDEHKDFGNVRIFKNLDDFSLD